MKTIVNVSLAIAIVCICSFSGSAGADDPCAADCSGSVSPPGAVILICPYGDTPTLLEQGIVVSLPFGAPVPEGSVYPLESCGDLVYCFPPAIDGPLSAEGIATVSGAVAGGGQSDSWVWATGFIPEPQCILVAAPVRIVSPDINADLTVNIQDFSLFGLAYPPRPYDPRADFDGNAVINLIDFSIFVRHYEHACE